MALAALLLLVASVAGYVNRGNVDGERVPDDSISIEGFAYAPSPLRIARGDTVTWVNNDEFAHTVTSATTDGPLSSGEIAADGNFRHTFGALGTFDYICTIHPTMRGRVEVTSQ